MIFLSSFLFTYVIFSFNFKAITGGTPKTDILIQIPFLIPSVVDVTFLFVKHHINSATNSKGRTKGTNPVFIHSCI